MRHRWVHNVGWALYVVVKCHATRHAIRELVSFVKISKQTKPQTCGSAPATVPWNWLIPSSEPSTPFHKQNEPPPRPPPNLAFPPLPHPDVAGFHRAPTPPPGARARHSYSSRHSRRGRCPCRRARPPAMPCGQLRRWRPRGFTEIQRTSLEKSNSGSEKNSSVIFIPFCTACLMDWLLQSFTAHLRNLSPCSSAMTTRTFAARNRPNRLVD